MESASISEVAKLVTARGEIVKQDEYGREADHRRRGENPAFYSKVVFSVAAIGVGAGLVLAGFGLPGFSLIGGSAAVYVPDYVKNYLSRNKSGGGDGR